MVQVDIAKLQSIVRGRELSQPGSLAHGAFPSAVFGGFEPREAGVAKVVWLLEGRLGWASG